MGRAMCKNIVEKGPLDQPLLLFNRTHSVASDLAQALGGSAKAEAVESVAAGVGLADIIFFSLTNDAVVSATVRDVLEAEGIGGKLLVDTSTVHPDTADALVASAAGAGAEFVSAPVFGPPAMAEAGQLVGVLAGAAGSVERARAYFGGVTCRSVIGMSGAACGRALTLKLIGNSFILNMVEQLAEVHVLAEKSGLGTDTLHRTVEALFPGPYVAYSTRMLTGDYHTRDHPLFAVDLARKDARHVMELAAAAGTTLANVETADGHLAKLKDMVGARGDLAGIYGVLRSEAGLEYKVNCYPFDGNSSN